jgi:beta-N-acetylhexosaminidase
MSAPAAADPALARLADAILIPPFPGLRAPGWVLGALSGGLAGVTLFGPNIARPGQLAALAARLHAAGDGPVIAIDEEGGDVTRIAHLEGSPYPGNAALGAVDDPALTEAVYRALGTDLAALGINLDLAPSVDVNSAADNPVIGTRSFGPDPELTARHGAAAVRGLQSAGVAACAKHFPGHGSTRSDSHHAIATVDAPLAEVRRRDLPPFAAAIAAGVAAVMPGHLRVPGLTGDLPASLSAAAQTGLLRGELGFTGMIVSDALEMRAVSRPFGIPEAAVLAVAAGTDLLCFGRDQDEETYLAVRQALTAAATEGRLPGARLEEAAARVGVLRAWIASQASLRAAARPDTGAGLASNPGGAGWPGQAGGSDQPGHADGPHRTGQGGGAGRALQAAGAHRGHPAGGDAGAHEISGVGLAAARRAVRVEGLTGPLQAPVVAEVVPPANIAVGQVPWGLSAWVPPADVLRLPALAASAAETGTGRSAAAVLDAAAGRPLVIVVRDAHRYPVAQDLVRRLVAARPDAVVVEMGLPVWRPPSRAYVATYGAALSSGRAAAEVLGLACR